MHLPIRPPDTSLPASAADHHDDATVDVTLDLKSGYAQHVDFGIPGSSLTIDEPPPLGENTGPSPSRVLSAALASCLGASLLFCLRKARIDVQGLHATAKSTLVRNEKGRLRIGAIDVHLSPIVPAGQHPRMTHCLSVFEDYCIVTASVRPGIDVKVEVTPVVPT